MHHTSRVKIIMENVYIHLRVSSIITGSALGERENCVQVSNILTT